MQPDSVNATTQPMIPLHWGQINFIHTSDSHGWLEGHIKEGNYGADWGDFVSFVKHMRDKASNDKVDLLVIDTGDLHDGNGPSDATEPNGKITNPIFENIDYDLLTPGNHELGVAEVAYDTFANFTKVYGDKYLASNVDICTNCQDSKPSTQDWAPFANRYRYFTTKQGLRIMAFGVILDLTNNNKSMTRIQTAADMVKEDWFQKAINRTDIDLFLLTGHNPVKSGIPKSESTFPLLMQTLRSKRPEIPVQGFGGHTHRRDFHIYDNMSSALESGKYCDTVGWISLDGIESQPVDKVSSIEVKGTLATNEGDMVQATNNSCTQTKAFDMKLTRRYLDWNRLTFAFHATGSQDVFTTSEGLIVSQGIATDRKNLNLTFVYGCAPQSYCISCKPFGDEGNIYTLVQKAAAATVINPDRDTKSRMIIVNQGAIRYDLVQGPFTVDDSYIVCPYTNNFKYIPDVPYSLASKVLDYITEAKKKANSKRSMTVLDVISSQMLGYDECENPSLHDLNGTISLAKPKTLFRRVLDDSTTPTPGYTTCDDLGDDGDDSQHSEIPEFDQPYYIQATAAFPENGQPNVTDVVFSDFLAGSIIAALNDGHPTINYTLDDTALYLPQDFTTNSFIPRYATIAWKNGTSCPVGG
ncbi:hypothetical protein N7466_001319 [Penicillium verhagenii]|uniref:uncharacterized protein n=1 Tax=Penicillium verhagenii TaxID=1562060 RepID=UPI0025458302|nr:uncharacterized protein N7466_001319 [Penicillium verhagenii]KAJ5948304.1 hypothetical protein N7466_001319 [Penicillium verhagenii]